MKTPERLRPSRPGLVNERLLALFVLGVMMLTPPFISIFNKPLLVFGVPLLYVYLFAGWALLILLMALAIERSDDPAAEPGTETPAARDETGEG